MAFQIGSIDDDDEGQDGIQLPPQPSFSVAHLAVCLFFFFFRYFYIFSEFSECV